MRCSKSPAAIDVDVARVTLFVMEWMMWWDEVKSPSVAYPAVEAPQSNSEIVNLPTSNSQLDIRQKADERQAVASANTKQSLKPDRSRRANRQQAVEMERLLATIDALEEMVVEQQLELQDFRAVALRQEEHRRFAEQLAIEQQISSDLRQKLKSIEASLQSVQQESEQKLLLAGQAQQAVRAECEKLHVAASQRAEKFGQSLNAERELVSAANSKTEALRKQLNERDAQLSQSNERTRELEDTIAHLKQQHASDTQRLTSEYELKTVEISKEIAQQRQVNKELAQRVETECRTSKVAAEQASRLAENITKLNSQHADQLAKAQIAELNAHSTSSLIEARAEHLSAVLLQAVQTGGQRALSFSTQIDAMQRELADKNTRLAAAVQADTVQTANSLQLKRQHAAETEQLNSRLATCEKESQKRLVDVLTFEEKFNERELVHNQQLSDVKKLYERTANREREETEDKHLVVTQELQHALAASNHAKAQAESQLGHLRRQLDELLQRLSEAERSAETSVAALVEGNKRYDCEVERLMTKVDRLEQTLSEQQAIHWQLEQDLEHTKSEANQRLAHAKHAEAATRQQLEQLEDDYALELEKLESNIVSLECELGDREKTVEAMQTAVTWYEQQAARVQLDLEAIVRRLAKNLQDVSKSRQKQTETNATLRAQHAQAETAAIALISERLVLRAELIELQGQSLEKNADAERRIEILQGSLSRVEAERNALSIRFREHETQSQVHATHLSQSLAESEAQCRVASQKIDGLQLEFQELADHRRQLQNEQQRHALLVQQIEQLEYRLAERQRRLTAAEQSLVKRSKQIASLKTELEATQRCAAQLTEANTAMTQEFFACKQKLEQELKEAIEATARAEADKAQLAAEHEIALREHAKTLGLQSEQLAWHKSESEAAQRLNVQLTYENAAAKQEFVARQQYWQREHQLLVDAKERAQANFAQLTQEHEGAMREHEQRCKRLMDDLQAGEEKTRFMQEELARTLERAQEAERLREACSSRVTQLEAQQEQMEATIQRLHELAEQHQRQLHRQAAARRKAEAAFKRIAEGAEVDSLAHISKSQFAALERVERLTRELVATRQLCEKFRRQAIAQSKTNRQQREQSHQVIDRERRKAG